MPAKVVDNLRRVATLLSGIGANDMANDVNAAIETLNKLIGHGLYSIGTWDGETQSYTPQAGCLTPWHNVDIRGLRVHLKELRSMGYQVNRNSSDDDAMVYVERTDGATEAEVLQSWAT